jgi:hypothetical protein
MVPHEKSETNNGIVTILILKSSHLTGDVTRREAHLYAAAAAAAAAAGVTIINL